jgi:hypothetical protein
MQPSPKAFFKPGFFIIDESRQEKYEKWHTTVADKPWIIYPLVN